jgi:hypothetical protein
VGIDALQRGQTGHGRCACFNQVETVGNPADVLRVHRHVLGVETAFSVGELVSPNSILYIEAPYPGALRRDDSGTIDSQHQGEALLAGAIGALPDIGVPHADARGVQGDEDLAGSRLGDRKGVRGEDFRWSELIDGYGFHRTEEGSALGCCSRAGHGNAFHSNAILRESRRLL